MKMIVMPAMSILKRRMILIADHVRDHLSTEFIGRALRDLVRQQCFMFIRRITATKVLNFRGMITDLSLIDFKMPTRQNTSRTRKIKTTVAGARTRREVITQGADQEMDPMKIRVEGAQVLFEVIRSDQDLQGIASEANPDDCRGNGLHQISS
jgi:hypothetical protein